MKTPRSKLPPDTENPIAVGSLLAGKVTVPNSGFVESTLRRAPDPMKRVASVIAMVSRSPFSAWAPATSGSSIPLTIERLKSTVALPNTTSAMARPTLPPMRKVASLGDNVMPASAKVVWDQSSTLPPATEVRFMSNRNAVPISLSESTPCNWALPSAACTPVYLRTAPAVFAVSTARFRLPLATLRPTAVGESLGGRTTRPKVALAESRSRVAPLPMNRSAWVTEITNRSPPRTPPALDSGSRTPEMDLRLTAIVALPKTTSAMLSPTLPPIRKAASAGVNWIPTEASPGCVQSITRAALTEVWFNWNRKAVPINCTAWMPCS